MPIPHIASRIAQTALLALASLSSAHAGLTTYTSAASFTALVPDHWLEGSWPGGPQASPYLR